jgi:hypothetical protein
LSSLSHAANSASTFSLTLYENGLRYAQRWGLFRKFHIFLAFSRSLEKTFYTIFQKKIQPIYGHDPHLGGCDQKVRNRAKMHQLFGEWSLFLNTCPFFMTSQSSLSLDVRLSKMA